ncbi:MAG: hypothetical protein HS104_34805 [Polyangiaceae bacterium]|nr:hypothetical protein [Polyangiaceae bacterium]MCE7891607.1 hypothetical protein [Sorangiineae bacterium PRO1]MCL4752455.1 hypothetical protein [Myxococcales bacterium]
MHPGPFPGNPYAPSAKDESDLNLLSVLHYVWSALLGCSTLGVIGYFVLLGGIFGVSATSSGADPTGAAVAAGATLVMGVIVGIFMAALFVIHFLAASGLRNRKRRLLIFVASALMCTSVPLGTLLGVFTFIVMGRPGVKALFGAS